MQTEDLGRGGDSRYPVAMRVTALLFDLDKTLWHFPVRVTEDTWWQRCAEQIAPLMASWGAAADAATLSHRLLTEVEGARRAAAATALLSPDYAEILDRVTCEAGLSLDGAQLDALWAAWNVDGRRLGRQLFPDTLTTLAWARESGYRIGIISNRWDGAALLARDLASAGLNGLLDAVIVSSDAGWLKPHSAIYYTALRALASEPEETVMVGDSLRGDIAGAKMLGIRAVWKRNGRRTPRDHESPVQPDATIDDLWELRRIPWLARDRERAQV